MAEAEADSHSLRCSSLFSGTGIEESQLVGPDPLLPRARDAGGRFPKGSSANPQGRPRGIRNPRRRVPDLIARPLGAQALSNLLDRKPHLLRPLAMQLLPPLAARDPAERLGIDLSTARTAEDFRKVLSAALRGVAKGEIAPREAAIIARRVRRRTRAMRRLARVERRLARSAGPVKPPIASSAPLGLPCYEPRRPADRDRQPAARVAFALGPAERRQ